MKNHKVIVINGMARGGTNILWNIIQSHPEVCSTILETSQTLYPPKLKRLRPFINYILGTRIASSPLGASLLGPWLDNRFYQHKLKNFGDADNGYKYENEAYTEAEVARSVLCLKSVNHDIYLTDVIARIYADSYFIGIIRNGYALCESWMRRGHTPQKTGRLYRHYAEKILTDSQKYPRYRVIKFEDLLKNPFGQAETLFAFAQLEVTNIPQVRLKSKKILHPDGTYTTKYGETNAKYWFSPATIDQILEENISDIQAAALSDADKRAFEKEAGPILDYFNYR